LFGWALSSEGGQSRRNHPEERAALSLQRPYANAASSLLLVTLRLSTATDAMVEAQFIISALSKP
jgi:hypothetical protein